MARRVGYRLQGMGSLVSSLGSLGGEKKRFALQEVLWSSMQRLSSCIGFWNTLTLSSRTCFGIFVLILSEDGGPLTVNVIFTAFSGFRFLSVQQLFGRDPAQEHYGMTEGEFVGADSTECQYYSLTSS